MAEVRRRILRSSLIQSRSILLSFLPSVGRGKHRGVDAHPQKGRSARAAKLTGDRVPPVIGRPAVARQ